MGLPEERLLRRACGRSDEVVLLAYGGGKTVDAWWQANKDALAKQDKLTIKAVDSRSSKALSAMAERGMQLQCMIQDGEIWLSDATERVLIQVLTLMPTP